MCSSVDGRVCCRAAPAANDYTALVQKTQVGKKELAGQAPPPGFKSYEKNAASGGVMGMMSGIINDAKAMEAEAIRGEESAQKQYEEFVKDSNLSIRRKQRTS